MLALYLFWKPLSDEKLQLIISFIFLIIIFASLPIALTLCVLTNQ